MRRLARVSRSIPTVRTHISSAFCVERFLPNFCDDFSRVAIDEDGHEVRQKNQGPPKRLDFAVWLLAWDGYALAAAMLEQMSYATALSYKAIVAEVAAGAGAESEKPRSTALAVIYDELQRHALIPCRVGTLPCSLTRVSKKWEDMSGKLGKSFRIDTMVALDVSLRERAVFKFLLLCRSARYPVRS